MSTIIVSVRRIDTQSGFDAPTTADVELVVKDSPINVERHLRLLGLLASANIILSDDDGVFTISVQEKEK